MRPSACCAAACGRWPRERDGPGGGEASIELTVRRVFGTFRTAVTAAQRER